LNVSGLVRRDRRFLKTLFVIYKWSFVLPFLLLSTFVCGSFIILLSILGAPDLASHIFGPAWAKMNAFVSMMKVEVKGAEKLDRTSSYIIAANHQSLVDIYVIYGYLGMDMKWVMKQELRKVPILGLCAELMGHILIDRSNSAAALASINNAKNKIQNGMCVIFFPEGTRSRTGELKPFKKGAFRLSKDLGIPTLPVAITGTNQVLPSDSVDLMPGKVTLEFCDPIYELEDQTAATLSKQAFQSINAVLTRCETEKALSRS